MKKATVKAAAKKPASKPKPKPKPKPQPPAALKPSEQAPTTGRDKFMAKVIARKDDNIFVDVEIKSLKDLTGFPVRNGFSQAVISNGKIVNVVSPNYGLVPNEKFFLEVEKQLIDADIQYVARSTNRRDFEFAVDYILNDPEYFVDVRGRNKKGEKDIIIPMMRFTNTYGGGPSTGTFGFFRQVCENGLHVAETKIGFKVLHRAKALEIVLPNIKELVGRFLSNEFYSLHKKFKVLAETPIKDVNEFVKYTCTKLDLFKYEASEKNPTDPSKKAQKVLDKIAAECKQLEIAPNLWIGYNAFNGGVHESEKQSFNRQRKVDGNLFNTVFELTNAVVYN